MKKQWLCVLLVLLCLCVAGVVRVFREPLPEQPGLAAFGTLVSASATRVAKEEASRKYQGQQSVQGKEILAALPRVSRATSHLEKRWNSRPMVFDLQFSPDGSLLAVAASGNYSEPGVDLRSTRDWSHRKFIAGASRIAWSPNSRLLAIENQGVDVWDVRLNRRLWTLNDWSGTGSAAKNGVYGPLLFSADSSKLATLGEDPNSTWKLDGPATDAAIARIIALKVWDVTSGKSLLVKPGPWSFGAHQLVRLWDDPAKVEFAQVAGYHFAVSATVPKIYVFDASAPRQQLFGVTIHPDQPYVAIGVKNPLGVANIAGNAWIYGAMNPRNNAVEIFCTADQKLLLRLPHERPVTAFAFSPDAKTLVIAHDAPFSPNQSVISVYRLLFSTKKLRATN